MLRSGQSLSPVVGGCPALAAGALTLVFVIAGLAVDRFDAGTPPEQLMYALDADTGAGWVSTVRRRGWS